MYVYHNNKKIKAKKLDDGSFSLDLSNKNVYYITDIQGLMGIENLTVLKLDRNHIQEITGLETLQHLRTLSLAYNEIREIKSLDTLYNLKKLDLSHNLVGEIKGLDSLKNLVELNLWSNSIAEIKGLDQLDNLNTISLTGNPVHKWVRNTFGSYRHLARDLVIYCKKLEGEIVFNQDEFDQFLLTQRKEIDDALKNNNFSDAMSAIAEVFYVARTEDRTLFYDFVGKFLRDYPEIQKNPRFQDQYNIRLNMILTKDQRYEMDHYLLDNFYSPKPVKISSGIHFCPNCGTKLEEDWKACPNCGTKLKEEPQISPSVGYLEPAQAAPPDILKTFQPKSSTSGGFGIAAIILGLIGCCCTWCAGVLAIILAFIGLSEDEDKTLSTIGLIIGICGTCGGIFQLIWLSSLLSL
ncbi:MAG: zinc-ribbon domain-containing protein [Promethearchaeota archaeon]|nr:MAG: zinc-ribbon domain-containing protein [Candidatus Lokiarchaeota archaeon]